jgi:hypothetical protein
MNWRYSKLTDHFQPWEFECHGAGDPCDCHGAFQVDERLLAALEEFRSMVGGPLQVTCGFRCDSHNRKVGGHTASFHRLGMAADITSFELRKDLEGWAMKAGQVIEGRCGREVGNVFFYPRRLFLHMDGGHRIADLVRPGELTGAEPPGGV